jgi:glyoxylase-like metal-dependent hydrolase (beta-lactamase superfamily II)
LNADVRTPLDDRYFVPLADPVPHPKVHSFTTVLRVTSFTFNPFQENTFVLDDGQQAIVIDPGCWNTLEERDLEDHLAKNGLTPVRLILTHSHIDHVLGCAWMHKRFGLLPELHPDALEYLRRAPEAARLYGIHYEAGPAPQVFLNGGDAIELGGELLDVLFVPGHAPGHIALHSAEQRFVIAGDVLFNRSIGRVDLPGGDFATLEHSIREKLYVLPDDTVVHCGHGPATTIGEEKRRIRSSRPEDRRAHCGS